MLLHIYSRLKILATALPSLFINRDSVQFQFVQSIVILTSDYTASAAEVFLLLMKDLPYVTIVGDHSEGIFSDVYEFKLPNKWEIGLSHQQFFSMDSTNYEG